MKVVIITCEGQTERQESVKQWAQHLGSVQWHTVQRDNLCPRRGVYNSHRDVARAIVASKSTEATLILEDDAVPTVPLEQLQSQLHDLTSASDEFDIHYLGLNAQRAQIWSAGMYRVAGFCLHAYVLSPSGAKKLASLPLYTGIEVDRLVMEQCGLHNPDWGSSWVCMTQMQSLVHQQKRQFVSLLTPNDIRYKLSAANSFAEGLDTIMHAWVFKIEQLIPRHALLIALLAMTIAAKSKKTRAILVLALGLIMARLERV